MKMFGLHILTNRQLIRLQAQAIETGAKAAMLSTNKQMITILEQNAKLTVSNDYLRDKAKR